MDNCRSSRNHGGPIKRSGALSLTLDSRSSLIGRGVVCGLELFTDDNSWAITLNPGTGLTSLGYIISVEESRKFSYLQIYEDIQAYFSQYATFERPVYELFSDPGEGRSPLTPQSISSVEGSNPAGEYQVVDLNSWVFVLYLENTNPWRVKHLLVHEQDMEQLMIKSGELRQSCVVVQEEEEEEVDVDSLFMEDELPSEGELFNFVRKESLLNDITIRRLGYSSIDLNEPSLTVGNIEPCLEGPSLKHLYDEYIEIIDEAIVKLKKGIDSIHEYFQEFIPRRQRLFVDAYMRLLFTRIASYKDRYKDTGHWSAQYLYDFVRNLIKTHNELCEELRALMADCNPDVCHFPFHLMLGKPKQEITFQRSIYRHLFRQPPLYNDNADRLQKARFLHWRILNCIKAFYVPDPDFDNSFYEYNLQADQFYVDVLKRRSNIFPDIFPNMPIRITPSRAPEESLGVQAIPFYYFLSRDVDSLQHFWDYHTTKYNKEDHHFSYFASYDPESYTRLDEIIQPFVFAITDYPFYRIEGHMGKSMNATMVNGEYVPGALRQILEWRNHCNLCFDVIEMHLREIDELFNILKGELTEIDETGEIQLIQKRGLEHLGGVRRGGTFILVYDDQKRVVADFSLPYYFDNHSPQQIDDGPKLVTVQGQVINCQTGEGIAGAQIKIGEQTVEFDETESGIGAGSFEIALMPGNYPVQAILDGFQLFEGELDTFDTEMSTSEPYFEIELIPLDGQVTLIIAKEGEAVYSTPDEVNSNIELKLVTGSADEPIEFSVVKTNQLVFDLPAGKQIIEILNKNEDQDLDPETYNVGFFVNPCDEDGIVVTLDLSSLERPREDITIEGSRPFPVTSAWDTIRQRLINELLREAGKFKGGERDDLTKIKGIGPKIQAKINDIGIYTYEQLSKLSQQDFEILEELIGIIGGTANRYSWRQLAKDEYTKKQKKK